MKPESVLKIIFFMLAALFFAGDGAVLAASAGARDTFQLGLVSDITAQTVTSDAEAARGPLAKKGRAAIDIVRPARFSTKRTDTVDGVLFTISTNKKVYKPGESIQARYSIENRSMGTVVYDFSSSCQFDLRVIGSRGTIVYSRLSTQPCGRAASRLTLSPSAEKIVEFAPVPLRLKKADTLTIKAQMAGYPLSAVPLKIAYGDVESAASEPIALEGFERNNPPLEFDTETRVLIIRLDRTRRLAISAFVLTGKKVDKLSCERILARGTHRISFNNKKLADGVVIFKVEGDGFSETKVINLAH